MTASWLQPVLSWFTRSHSRGRGIVVALASVILCATGCAGKQVPEPPRATQEAHRLAAQGAKLQAEGKSAAAATWWRKAGIQFQLLNQLTNLAVAWHNEAVCLRATGDVEAAHALLEDAAALNEQLGENGGWWRNQVVLLQLENDTDPPQGAARWQSLEPRLSAVEDARLRALFEHETARVRAHDGQFNEALAAARQASQDFETIGDQAGLAAVAVTRARILRRTNQLSEALESWESALSVYEALGDPRGIAVALSGLGECLAAAGHDPARAEALLRRAAENFRVLNLEKEAVAAEALLGTPP